MGERSVFAEFPWLTDVFPEYTSVGRELVDLLFGGDEASVLPGHVRELVAATALAYRGSPASEVHINRAIEAGASFRQVVEAFLVATVPGGNAVLFHAAPTLARLHAELGEHALDDPRAGPNGEDEAFKTPRQSGRPAWAMLDVYASTESRRQALAAMLWEPVGAIALPVAHREIVAAPLFADRAYPTTRKHLKRAIEEGASIRECLEAIVIAGHLIGWPIVNFTLPILIDLEEQLGEA